MATSDLVTGIFIVLAVVRFVRLVALDTIAEPFRSWVWGKFGPSSKMVALISCPWCLGWWFSVAMVVFARTTGLIGGWPAALVMIPACAYGAAAVSIHVERQWHGEDDHQTR